MQGPHSPAEDSPAEDMLAEDTLAEDTLAEDTLAAGDSPVSVGHNFVGDTLVAGDNIGQRSRVDLSNKLRNKWRLVLLQRGVSEFFLDCVYKSTKRERITVSRLLIPLLLLVPVLVSRSA